MVAQVEQEAAPPPPGPGAAAAAAAKAERAAALAAERANETPEQKEQRLFAYDEALLIKSKGGRAVQPTPPSEAEKRLTLQKLRDELNRRSQRIADIKASQGLGGSSGQLQQQGGGGSSRPEEKKLNGLRAQKDALLVGAGGREGRRAPGRGRRSIRSQHLPLMLGGQLPPCMPQGRVNTTTTTGGSARARAARKRAPSFPLLPHARPPCRADTHALTPSPNAAPQKEKSVVRSEAQEAGRTRAGLIERVKALREQLRRSNVGAEGVEPKLKELQFQLGHESGHNERVGGSGMGTCAAARSLHARACMAGSSMQAHPRACMAGAVAGALAMACLPGGREWPAPGALVQARARQLSVLVCVRAACALRACSLSNTPLPCTMPASTRAGADGPYLGAHAPGARQPRAASGGCASEGGHGHARRGHEQAAAERQAGGRCDGRH